MQEQPIQQQSVEVEEQPVLEQSGRTKLGHLWPPLTQALTSKLLEKTRFSALSISEEQSLDPVIQEEQQIINPQMTQEVTKVI